MITVGIGSFKGNIGIYNFVTFTLIAIGVGLVESMTDLIEDSTMFLKL